MAVTANFAGPVQTDAINRFRMLQSMARSHQGAAQTIANATYVALTLDTNDINTDGIWSLNANTKFTAQIAGKYLVSGGVGSLGAAGLIAVRKGGTLYAQSPVVNTPGGFQGSVCDLVPMLANDYVEIVVYQASGGSVTTGQTNSTFGAILYVGE